MQGDEKETVGPEQFRLTSLVTLSSRSCIFPSAATKIELSEPRDKTFLHDR